MPLVKTAKCSCSATPLCLPSSYPKPTNVHHSHQPISALGIKRTATVHLPTAPHSLYRPYSPSSVQLPVTAASAITVVELPKTRLARVMLSSPAKDDVQGRGRRAALAARSSTTISGR